MIGISKTKFVPEMEAPIIADQGLKVETNWIYMEIMSYLSLYYINIWLVNQHVGSAMWAQILWYIA